MSPGGRREYIPLLRRNGVGGEDPSHHLGVRRLGAFLRVPAVRQTRLSGGETARVEAAANVSVSRTFLYKSLFFTFNF